MPKVKRPAHARAPSLRAVPASARFFWKHTTQEQLALEIEDTDAGGFARCLPKNELLCMALNEIAAEERQGFFLYLPSREHWKTPSHDAVQPPSRRSPAPGARYPSIIYMNFTWTEAEQARFATESQRGRYLKCNAIINRPADYVPLFALQLIDHARAVAYFTPTPSLVIYQTSESYYLASTTELLRPQVVGRWSKSWAPQGPEPQARLNTAPFLWQASSNDAISRRTAMRDLEHDTLEALYAEISHLCSFETSSSLESTFTAAQMVHEIVPRPTHPTVGVAVGHPQPQRGPTGLAVPPVEPSSDPPSRRGIRRNGSKKQGTYAAGDLIAEADQKPIDEA
ncbi:hypothetical protein LTR53_001012 [Teratosphaeriaceae sp. CCFEE 6253]|nr:hypothetical protein LTR53_001012 [Teratosphaeriaceae sp. CCFEE 6253]